MNKTFVIVRKEDLAILGDYADTVKDESSNRRSYLVSAPICTHIELPEGLDLSLASAKLEGEEIVLFEDPEKVANKIKAQKAALVQAAYDKMNADVLAKMAQVFGTQKPESATAYKETWDLMAQEPALWVDKGLKAAFAVASLEVGEGLNTETKVQDYASAKLAEIKEYGIWRMQRIEDFKQERDTIISQ